MKLCVRASRSLSSAAKVTQKYGRKNYKLSLSSFNRNAD